MTEYRLTADTWVRIDPDTIDDRSPRIRRLVKGDIVPNVTEAEIEYLTTGARPHLVEADSENDPFKDSASHKHVAGQSRPNDNPSVDTGTAAQKKETADTDKSAAKAQTKSDS